MMRRIRHRVLVVCLIFTILLLTAGSAVAEKVEVKFDAWWGPGPIVDMFKEWAKEFNKIHPNIEVKVIPGVGGQAGYGLVKAIAAGTQPDAAIFDGFQMAQWVEQGVFQPLDPYIKRDNYDISDIPPGLLEEVRFGGDFYVPSGTDIYGIPGFGLNVWLLVWNKSVFRESGLNPEKPPLTWEETEVYTDKITRRDARGRLTRAGFIPWGEGAHILTYLWGMVNGASFISKDGTKVTCNDPKAIEAFNWLVKFVKKYGVDELRRFQAGFAGPIAWGGSPDCPLFVGQLGMAIEANMTIANIRRYAPKLDYGVAPLPVPKEGMKPTTLHGGVCVTIPRGAKHPHEAWEWIKFITSQEHWIDFYGKFTALPGSLKAIEALRLREKDIQHMGPYFDALSYAVARPKTPISAILYQEMLNAGDLIITLKSTPEKALEDVRVKCQKELDAVIARNK